MLAPLKHRNFRLLYSGQLISNLGDWLDYLALLVIIVYKWHYGPSALAVLVIVVAFPYAFIAPFAGVLADRWPKKPVLVGCDLARAAAVLGLVFAPNIYVLLALVFTATTFGTLFNAAEQSTIRQTVPEDELLAANSLAQLSVQGMKVLGPALGGVIVAASSPRVAFAIDSATFLASAAFLSRLPRLAVPPTEEEPEGFWSQLGAGFGHIRKRRALVMAIGSLCAVVFVVFMFDTLSPLAFRELGVSVSLFGLAIAAIGAGAVLGTILIGQLGRGRNPFGLMSTGELIVGGLVALMGIAIIVSLDAPTAVWIPVALVIGIASAGVLVSYPTVVQLETPPELMGRVSAMSNSLPTVLQLVAPIAGAALAEWQGVGFVLTLGGCALAVIGVTVGAIGPLVESPPAEPAVEAAAAAAQPDVVGFMKRDDEGGAA